MSPHEQRAARLAELLGPLCEAERVSRELAALGVDEGDKRRSFRLGSLRVQVDTEIACEQALARRLATPPAPTRIPGAKRVP